MSIVKMKKLRLIALRSSRDELMRALMRFGQVELREATLAEPEQESLLKAENCDLVSLRTEQAAIQKAIELLDAYAPAKSGLFTVRPEVAGDTVLDAEALKSDLLLAERIVGLDERIRQCDSELSGVRGTIESLRPWEALDYPLESDGTKTVAAIFGTLRAESDPSELQAAAQTVSEDVQLFRVSSDSDQHRFFVLCMKSEREDMIRALHEAGFEPVSFPGLKGTAKENVDARQKELRTLNARRDALVAEIEDCAKLRDELKLGSDRMELSVRHAEAVSLLRGTGSVVLLEGWIPAEEEPKLAELLDGFDCAWETEEPTEEEYPETPVKLKNNVFTRALNMVTGMYSLPAYGSTDPNPLMAPFFILFYGMMMADMGYGLLMILGAVFVLKKMRPRESMRNFGDLLLYCGISTFLFGAATGGFFGDFIPQVAKIINPDTKLTALPALFTPLTDTMPILIAALALGLIQTITGMAVSVRNKFRAGDWANAVFDEITWWVILLGLGLMALKLGNVAGYPVVLLLGCAMLVGGQFYLKKSFGGGLVGVLVSVYNGSTGFFSDILSYSRLMALMLSGSIIATVFNTLGTIPGSSVVGKLISFVIISVFGNALNFALNILGCYVHDLRLQCLEFFGRFYSDGGRPFSPINLETKYVDIIKEEN